MARCQAPAQVPASTNSDLDCRGPPGAEEKELTPGEEQKQALRPKETIKSALNQSWCFGTKALKMQSGLLLQPSAPTPRHAKALEQPWRASSLASTPWMWSPVFGSVGWCGNSIPELLMRMKGSSAGCLYPGNLWFKTPRQFVPLSRSRGDQGIDAPVWRKHCLGNGVVGGTHGGCGWETMWVPAWRHRGQRPS